MERCSIEQFQARYLLNLGLIKDIGDIAIFKAMSLLIL